MKQCLLGIKSGVEDAISLGACALTQAQILGFEHYYDGIIFEEKQQIPIMKAPKLKNVAE